MASATLSVTSGKAHVDPCSLHFAKLGTLGSHPSQVSFPSKLSQSKARQTLAVRAEYKGGSRNGGGEFLAGFLLGGAIFGTVTYIFAPQIRRAILNENEHGFRRPRRHYFYDEGLEQNRLNLNEKISQLNAAIDSVASKLLRRNSALPSEEADGKPELEAKM